MCRLCCHVWLESQINDVFVAQFSDIVWPFFGHLAHETIFCFRVQSALCLDRSGCTSALESFQSPRTGYLKVAQIWQVIYRLVNLHMWEIDVWKRTMHLACLIFSDVCVIKSYLYSSDYLCALLSPKLGCKATSQGVNQTQQAWQSFYNPLVLTAEMSSLVLLSSASTSCIFSCNGMLHLNTASDCEARYEGDLSQIAREMCW